MVQTHHADRVARTPRLLRAALPLLTCASLLMWPGLATSDDTELFSTVVPPNVILLVDNSGSMHHVVWHPAFDPTMTPSCTFFDNDTQYLVNSTNGDTNGPSSAGDTSFRSGTYSLPTPPVGCVGGSREIFHDPLVDANGESTRWMGRYLNWMYSAESSAIVAPATVSPLSELALTANGTFSTCLGGGTFSLYRRSRITAAQQILRDVICRVNAAGEVRFGLAQFRRPIFPDIDTTSSDPNGGFVRVPANDYLDGTGSPNVYTLNGVSQSHGAHLDDAIDDLTGESWTPLAESLLQIYSYFMSRTAADRPPGAVSGTFPEYEFTTSGSSGQGGPYSSTNAPGSPVQHACQKNFVIIITDGEPTRDDFDLNAPTNTATGFAAFPNLIGDFNVDGEDETPTGFPGCTTGCEPTRWLDDIAKFMQERDFRPDLAAHNGQEQVIDVYTVGFTTSPFANAVLQKTANVGNGQFYFSNDPEKLAQDIVSAVSDIIQKAQSFTAATVPAVRTSDGGKFYTSLFVPSREDGYWEGHLKSWTINNDGTIFDAGSPPSCALNDPSGDCLSGPFLSTAVPFWDAGERLNLVNPGSRNLRTSISTGPTTSVMTAFTSANVLDTHLGVTAADIPLYDTTPNPAPTTSAELATMLVDNVRGCELGTFGGGCVPRSWLLGDIFHSNPAVVPGPQSFIADPAYQTFENTYEQRDRMIIAGANDGFVHFFDAGTFQSTPAPGDYDDGTGDEVAAFMPYTARQNAKELPIDSNGRNFYYVDGPPNVADVWLYDLPGVVSNGSDWPRWRTVLVGTMRQGGRQVYALDVTNPGGTCVAPATGSNYPCYLWEFPREGAASGAGTDKGYMGYTYSEAIITKVRVDFGGTIVDRWVAIFGAGYDTVSDPNHGSYDATATAGRAIYMIDVKTGQVLARKAFDADPGVTPAASTDPGAIPYVPTAPEKYMHYGFAGTPGVYDIDFDGYADIVLIGDLGGNVWKWVVSPVGQDPINGPGSVSQPNWHFGRFFSAPTEVVAGKRYYKSQFHAPSATFKGTTLWYAFGTGERTNLTFAGFGGSDENNRFYAMTDLAPEGDPQTTAVLTEADLVDVTTDNGANCPDVSSTARGFYFKGVDGEKFITQSDIFFYNVFVASYIPTNTGDPCTSSGSAKLYAFKVYCGEGLYDTDGDGASEAAISLGAGLPTAPKITIGSGGGGGGGGPTANRVIVNMQDGNTNNNDGDDGSQSQVGQFYWREL